MSTETINTEQVNPTMNPQSPLSLQSLLNLLFKPSKFFSNPEFLFNKPEVLLVGWVSGIAHAMDRIDTKMMKAELGKSRSSWEAFGPWLTESWIHYWAFMLCIGLISGLFLWYFGGWWYHLRLKWSGATDIEKTIPRAIYIYQNFVAAVPIIIVTIIQTFVFSNYYEAWAADESWSSVAIIFIFWSCITSYIAASTAFNLTKWKARLWFLILPISIYCIAFGAIAAIYVMLQNGAA